MNRSSIAILFTCLGLLAGLFARDAIDVARDPMVVPMRDAIEAPGTTAAIELRAVLDLPTPKPTMTPRPTATATPDPARLVDVCGSPIAGALCRVPDLLPPTPTPYPSCPDVLATPGNAGDWCIWPTRRAEGATR